MGTCKHRHKKFIAVTDYRGYPEKIYSCQDCGMMITDFASDGELRDFNKQNKKEQATTLRQAEDPEEKQAYTS
jgi:hypothetical protein